MRAIVEAVHIAVGIAAAVVIALLGTWAYPQARQDIWIVAVAMMVAVAVMGIKPLRAAMAADKARRYGAGANG